MVFSNNRTGDWFATHSGIQFYLTDPHPDDVNIKDIAHALSNVCRFGGHASEFYSVAQHSIYCMEFLKESGYGPTAQLYVLLHDASEAYIGDIVRPFKITMPSYLELEARTMQVIHEGLGLRSPSKLMHSLIKWADNTLLMTERRDLITNRNIPWNIPEEPWSKTITPQASGMMKAGFLMHYEKLIKLCKQHNLKQEPSEIKMLQVERQNSILCDTI